MEIYVERNRLDFYEKRHEVEGVRAQNLTIIKHINLKQVLLSPFVNKVNVKPEYAVLYQKCVTFCF